VDNPGRGRVVVKGRVREVKAKVREVKDRVKEVNRLRVEGDNQPVVKEVLKVAPPQPPLDQNGNNNNLRSNSSKKAASVSRFYSLHPLGLTINSTRDTQMLIARF